MGRKSGKIKRSVQFNYSGFVSVPHSYTLLPHIITNTENKNEKKKHTKKNVYEITVQNSYNMMNKKTHP